MASFNSILTQDINKTATIPLLVISVLVEFFLLVTGNLLFGNLWNGYNNIIIIYMVVTFGLMSVTHLQSKQITFFGTFAIFVPVFLMTGLLIGSIYNTSYIANNGFLYEVMQLILQIFVVTLSEEMIFRGILLNYIGVIPQGIIFGLFHYAAYSSITGLNIGSLITTMILGVALGYIVKYMPQKYDPLAISWGIHAGWNVALLTGLFSALFVVG